MMVDLLFLLLLYILGCIGWILFRKLKAPSPAILGSLLFVGLLRGVGIDLPVCPSWFSRLSQIILGFYMGSMLTKDTVKQTKTILIPALIIPAWAIGFTLFGGWLVYVFIPLDFATALLAVSPGGITEMVVVAMEINADVLTVLVLQTLRVILFMSGYPVLIKWLSTRQPGVKAIAATSDAGSTAPKRDTTLTLNRNFVFSLFFSVGGGLFLAHLGVPAGSMLGSLLGMMIANFMGFGIRLNSPILFSLILVGVGITVADSVTPATMGALFSLAMLPTILISMILTLASALLLTVIISKVTGWDWIVCILACAPAGLSSMPALALEYNRDPLPISLLHLSRLVTVKALVPLFGMFLL